MTDVPLSDPAAPDLLADLRRSAAWLGPSLVAELDGELAGHVSVSRGWVGRWCAHFQVWRLPAYHGDVTGALVYPDVLWRHDAVGLRP